jgi:hypothetical protein
MIAKSNGYKQVMVSNQKRSLDEFHLLGFMNDGIIHLTRWCQEVLDVGFCKHLSKLYLCLSGKMQTIFLQWQTLSIDSHDIGQVNTKLSSSHFLMVPFIPRCKSDLFQPYIIVIKIVALVVSNGKELI